MKKLWLALVIIFLTFVLYNALSFFSLYFEDSKIHLIKNSNLYPVSRHIPVGNDKYREMFVLLKSGPKLWEKLMGVNTAIPTEMQLIDISINGDTVFIDFVDDIEQWHASAHEVRLAIAQIVYTYTEIPGIKKVAFSVEGKKKTLVLGSDGFMVNKPLSRQDINSINKE